MTDVESVQPRANRSNNPYADSGSPVRSRWHPLNILQRGTWMGGSIYLLHRMNTYNNILTSPDISHQWFKVGLASSVGEFTLVYIPGVNRNIFLLYIDQPHIHKTVSLSFKSFILAEGIH